MVDIEAIRRRWALAYSASPGSSPVVEKTVALAWIDIQALITEIETLREAQEPDSRPDDL